MQVIVVPVSLWDELMWPVLTNGDKRNIRKSHPLNTYFSFLVSISLFKASQVYWGTCHLRTTDPTLRCCSQASHQHWHQCDKLHHSRPGLQIFHQTSSNLLSHPHPHLKSYIRGVCRLSILVGLFWFISPVSSSTKTKLSAVIHLILPQTTNSNQN